MSDVTNEASNGTNQVSDVAFETSNEANEASDEAFEASVAAEKWQNAIFSGFLTILPLFIMDCGFRK